MCVKNFCTVIGHRTLHSVVGGNAMIPVSSHKANVVAKWTVSQRMALSSMGPSWTHERGKRLQHGQALELTDLLLFPCSNTTPLSKTFPHVFTKHARTGLSLSNTAFIKFIGQNRVNVLKSFDYAHAFAAHTSFTVHNISRHTAWPPFLATRPSNSSWMPKGLSPLKQLLMNAERGITAQTILPNNGYIPLLVCILMQTSRTHQWQ